MNKSHKVGVIKIESAYFPCLSKRGKNAFKNSFMKIHRPWGTEWSFVLPIKDCAPEIALFRRMNKANKAVIKTFGRKHEAVSRVVIIRKMRMKPLTKIIIRTSLRFTRGGTS